MAWDTIAAALSSVNGAIDLAKGLTAANGVIERSDLILKLAEMREALAEVKELLLQSKEDQKGLHEEIERLKEAIQTKGAVTRHDDGIYFKDDNGQATGSAFCLGCWEAHHRLRSLVAGERMDPFVYCVQCKAKYTRRRTLNNPLAPV